MIYEKKKQYIKGNLLKKPRSQFIKRKINKKK